MGKYIGPKIKIIRRLGLLPGLTQKIIKEKRKTPGEHGKLFYIKQRRTSLSEDYKTRLLEKQKLRFNYGVSERTLFSYYKEAKRRKSSTGLTLLELLEARLDCIVYRGGFASTIAAAKQLINHGHLLVNNKKVNISSFLCKTGDLISVKKNIRSEKLVKFNLEIELLKKKFISSKIKETNFILNFFNNLIPKHIVLSKDNCSLKVISRVKRNNVLIKINELKVVEYYSK